MNNWKDMFIDADEILADLPDHRPTVCWTVSAGVDTRPLVFFSEPWLHSLEMQMGLEHVPRPDFFVHTCLPGCGVSIDSMQRHAFLDRASIVHTKRFSWLSLQACFGRQIISEEHYAFLRDLGDMPHVRAARVDVMITSLTMPFRGRSTILYLEMENIHAFDSLMSQGWFDVTHLVATREGLAFGGCRKSIVDHLYRDGAIAKAMQHDCAPEFVVTWEGSTHRILMEHAPRWHGAVRTLGSYIGEQNGPGFRTPKHFLNRLG